MTEPIDHKVRAAVLREGAEAIVAENDRMLWATTPGKHWAADLLTGMAETSDAVREQGALPVPAGAELPMTPEVARVRLAQYGERTKTWSTATYDSGTERALHEIAVALLAEADALRARLAKYERPAEADGITRRIAPTQALRENPVATMRSEDTADIVTLASAQHADARYNPTFRTIELDLTATRDQWAEWMRALDVDLARTTNRGSCVTSHATWRGIHVVIRCWLAKPETGGDA
jgi:hypothetical protein